MASAPTMRAARWHGPGRALALEMVPEPAMRPGAVKVRVLATFVSPSMERFLADPGGLPLPPAPFTPGMSALGMVEDAEEIAPGTRVYCDPYIGPEGPASDPAGAFIGYFGFAPSAAPLLARWPDGGFADKALFPASCVTPLGAAASTDPAVLARIGHLGTAYEGFRRARLEAGQTAVVTGATGVLGVSAVMVALAMGAERVVAIGRRADALARLVGLAPKRVIPVPVAGGADDGALVRAAADGAEALLDCMGGAGNAAITRAAIAALRPGGTAVLVGGGGALALDYGDVLMREVAVRGSLWFARAVPRALCRLIGSGALDLSAVTARRFALAAVNEAVAAAAAPGRASGFEHVALVP